jgi:hypothetical protein
MDAFVKLPSINLKKTLNRKSMAIFGELSGHCGGHPNKKGHHEDALCSVHISITLFSDS